MHRLHGFFMVLLLMLVLVGSVEAQGGAFDEPGTYDERLMSGGFERRYLLHIPPSYDPTTPTPLVISYHGYTNTPDIHIEYTGLREKADSAGFILAIPHGQGDPAAWFTFASAELYGLDDVQFTRDLIDYLESQLNIDTHRIYATGMSNGGGMANRVACDLSDIVAAVAPVSANLFYHDSCQPLRSVPVLALHGQQDTTTPYDGLSTLLNNIPEWADEWAARNGCTTADTTEYDDHSVTLHSGCTDGADVVLMTYPMMGHEWPAETAPDLIWNFFAAHTLPSQYVDNIPAATGLPIPYVPPGNHIGWLENGSRYLLHMPLGQDLTQPLPLLINYHDYGVNPLESARMTGFSDASDQFGFIAVYPESLGDGFIFDPLAGSPDVTSTQALLDHLQAHLAIDTSRIYVAGFSLGGSMAYRVACEMADTVAAAVIVGGGTFVDDPCEPSLPVPILGIHANDDGVIPYRGNADWVGFTTWGEAWAEHNGCQGAPVVENNVMIWEDCLAPVRMVTVTGLGHQWPPDSAALFWAWMQEYTR